jgi:hypothetical protein
MLCSKRSRDWGGRATTTRLAAVTSHTGLLGGPVAAHGGREHAAVGIAAIFVGEQRPRVAQDRRGEEKQVGVSLQASRPTQASGTRMPV